MKALIMIDMQNEFLSPKGFLGKNRITSNHLFSNIARLSHYFRENDAHIIWVRSIYSDWKKKPAPKFISRPEGEKYKDIPLNDNFLSGTHFGKQKCCVRGNEMSDFHPLIEGLIQEANDSIIEKNWYSAFTDTSLHEILQKKQIKEVFISGVLTNVCVQAACTDAFFHGYDVTLIEDACNARNPKRHREAVRTIASYYATPRTTEEILHEVGMCQNSTTARLPNIGAGDSYVLYDLLDDSAEEIFQTAKNEITWHTMHLRRNPVSRKVALQATITNGNKPIYRHPADTQPDPVPWTEMSSRFKKIAEKGSNQEFNHALIQYYEDGNAWISPHTDKTLDIEHHSLIVNLSLGATRTMTLQQKDDRDEIQHITLPHGSLFILGPKTNESWFHSIRKDNRPEKQKTSCEKLVDGQRISYTFRNIATFQDAQRQLFGQGATRSSLSEQPNTTHSPSEQAQAMLTAFGVENRSTTFDWHSHYGAGFDVLFLSSLRENTKQRMLYWVNGSIPSWRVKIALEEKGIPYSDKRMKVMKKDKDTKTDDFLSINPRGTTPVFMDSDGVTVTESLAILHYLETYYPENPLLPDPSDKVCTSKVLSRVQETEQLRKVYRPLEKLFQYTDIQSIPSHVKEELIASYENVMEELAIWEGYAASSNFIAGDAFTLADCAFYPALCYQVRRGLKLKNQFPALKKYCKQMQKRKSIQAAQPNGWGHGKVGNKDLFLLCKKIS